MGGSASRLHSTLWKSCREDTHLNGKGTPDDGDEVGPTMCQDTSVYQDCNYVQCDTYIESNEEDNVESSWSILLTLLHQADDEGYQQHDDTYHEQAAACYRGGFVTSWIE